MTNSDALEPWEARALKGDFAHIPHPFLWQDSGRFAHFLNGYEEAGGFSELADMANAMSNAARETGAWRGSARELWMCLYFAHRAARHTGSGEGTPELDALAGALSAALKQLPPGEAAALASRLKTIG